MQGHINLCSYAAENDHGESLYKIWDDDLKRKIKRRNIYELIASSCLVGAAAVTTGLTEYKQYAIPLICFGILALYRAIIEFIDESNVNYLMHKWDLEKHLEMLRYNEIRESRRLDLER